MEFFYDEYYVTEKSNNRYYDGNQILGRLTAFNFHVTKLTIHRKISKIHRARKLPGYSVKVTCNYLMRNVTISENIPV